jgi:dTDP-4-dehydrorhamnose reductase
MVNEGVFSRFDFARLILDVAGYHDIPITPITSDTYSRLSTPPAYSPLANHFGAAMGVRMRPLEEALRKFISEA